MPSRAELEAFFPNLVGTRWKAKSDTDRHYNCIAWAAGESHRRWWPNLFPPLGSELDYWPPTVPREETIECFVAAFEVLGYKPCNKGNFEFGFQKVSIYADRDLTPTHMARMHLIGRGWLSKLGDLEDIVHVRLRDVEGDISPYSGEYGRAVKYLKRSWWRTFRHWRERRKAMNERRKST